MRFVASLDRRGRELRPKNGDEKSSGEVYLLVTDSRGSDQVNRQCRQQAVDEQICGVVSRLCQAN